MNKKKIIGSLSVLLIVSTLVTGCGNVKLKNGENAVVTSKSGNVSSDALYKKLVDKYGISTLVDLIDHKLFDKKYPTDDKEKSAIDSQITQMKSQYKDDEDTFLSAIQSYFGVSDEDELREVLSLEYKRNIAVEDYLKKNLTDKEIEDYYNNEITGDIKASHILIAVNETDDMTDEDKKNAENKAKEEAEKIIEKLDKGEDFAKLAKKYSADTASASKGGDLGYFNTNSNMDEAFMDAAMKLEVGKYSEEPVKSQYGYHIILKVKEKKKESLKKAKDSIKTTLVENKLNSDNTLHYKTLEDIREENNVTFKDSSLKKDYKELMDKLVKQASSQSTNS